VKSLLRPLAAIFVCLVTFSVSAQSFYEARFLSGVSDFNRGAYVRAVDELRVAAFGRVDDVAQYEIAEVYLAIAYQKLDRVDDARLAALKVIQAEQVSPVYTTLDLARDIRASFETLLPSLLNKDQLSHLSAFGRFASQAPPVQPATGHSGQQSKPAVPTPKRAPNVAVTVQKNDEGGAPPQTQQPQTQQPLLDYGKLALERVAAGDETAGRRYADLAIAADDTNVNAHTALARIAGAHSAWSDVAAHYAVVRTRRRLTDDESAAYVIALTKTGHVADALGVSRGLPAAVLSRNDVRQALQAIDPSPTPQPVAPQPISPMPVTVAQRPVPAPVSAGSTADSTTQPVSEQIAAAERMLGVSNIVGARSELRRVATLPNLQRSDRLALARALSQTALYAESSAQYRKTYPLKAGEESHMFYEAVNRYQIGDYDLARQLMTRALPSLPQTPAIMAYRDRILSQK
jgi:tetratricopeptide (TPR) repeat protein